MVYECKDNEFKNECGLLKHQELLFQPELRFDFKCKLGPGLQFLGSGLFFSTSIVRPASIKEWPKLAVMIFPIFFVKSNLTQFPDRMINCFQICHILFFRLS